MQGLKLCVWVIFIFRQPHQVIGGHPIKFRQRSDSKGTDVLIIVTLIFAESRFGKPGLFSQLLQYQVLIHYPQVF